MLSVVRALIENPFAGGEVPVTGVKVRDRGLAKNSGQIVTRFVLTNLWLTRKRLLSLVVDMRP